jgi:hypothetical protein
VRFFKRTVSSTIRGANFFAALIAACSPPMVASNPATVSSACTPKSFI